MRTVRLNVTTDDQGDGEKTQTPQQGGYSYLLYAVEWIKGTFDNGVDATLKCVNTLSGVDRTLLTLTDANADNVYYPRELEDDNAGAALTTYALPVVDGTLQLVVSDGGNAKTGGARVILLEA